MRSIPSKITGCRAAISCGAMVIVFAVVPNAHARRPRHKPPTPFSVALEPFKLTRSVIHAAAAPIVHNAPRVLAATAAAPIKLAYYAPRRLKPRQPRGTEQIYEADAMDESEAKPIRVAYQPSSRAKTAAPQAQEYDQEQDEASEQLGRVEQRGDRPMVSGSRAGLRGGIADAPSH